mmetsp:Transcript_15630/g.42639  ORF Transcript_15630/g.42639 Transcript_15630/m.42639 type:complete len:1180 (-) Transcript_15630:893-4432(-)
MLLQEQQGGIQIGIVELVRHTPPDGTELPTLLNDAVEERLHEHDLAPLVVVDFVKKLLRDHGGVCSVQASLQASWRFEGHLDHHLQETDGETEGDLTSDPEPEFFIDLGRLREDILLLVHEPNTKVTVLQNHPGTCQEAVLHLLESNHLLALAHGDLLRRELLALLRQLVDHQCGVTASCQQVENGFPSQGLLEDIGDPVSHWSRVLGSELIVDELRATNGRAVLPQTTNQDHAQEEPESLLHDDPVFVVWDGTSLRFIFVEPLPPVRVVLGDQLNDLSEEDNMIHAKWMSGQLQQIEPHLVAHPLEGVISLGLDVQRATRLQKHGDVSGRDHGSNRHDLESEGELEHHLISLEKAAIHVSVNLVGQVVDDLLHPLRRGLAFFGTHNGNIELFKELQQGTIVHPPRWLRRDGVGHQRHICHAEIHDTAPSRHRPELLSLVVDFVLLLSGIGEFLFHLLGLGLRVGEDINELHIVQEIARRIRKAEQELIVKHLQRSGVRRHLLLQCGQALLQTSLLFAQHTGEQLLLETLQCHGEVDHGATCAQLRREVRVGQPRRHVQHELRVEIHVLVRDVDVHIFALLDDGLVHHRVQHRIHVILDVFNDEAETFTHGELDLILQLGAAQRCDTVSNEILDAHVLPGLDPPVRLCLRVDHQRVPTGLRDHDTVLHREIVVGKTLHRPLPDTRGVHQELHQIDLLAGRHLHGVRFCQHLRVALVTELRIERSAISDETARQSHVTHEPLPPNREILRILFPTCVFTTKTQQEPVRRVHFLLRGQHVVFQRVLCVQRFLQFLVEHRHFRHDLVQLPLCGSELRICFSEFSLLDREEIHLRFHDLRGLVVLDHRPHEIAKTLRSLAGLGGNTAIQYLKRERAPVERGILMEAQVGIKQLASLIVDVVLLVCGEVQQISEELDVSEDELGDFVKGILQEICRDLVDRLGLRLHLDDLELPQDQQPVKGEANHIHRILVRLQVDNILFFDGIASCVRGVQKGQGLLQIFVRIFLVFCNDVSGVLATLALHANLSSFFLRLGFLDLHVGEKFVRLLLLDLQHYTLLVELHFHALHVCRGVSQLCETIVHVLLQGVDIVELPFVKSLVELDETQETFRRHVHILAHARVVRGALVLDDALEDAHQGVENQLLLRRRANLEVAEEVRAHSYQRLLWPRQKPIDVHAREDGREFL